MRKLNEMATLIVSDALIFNKDEPIAGHSNPDDWIFDCRRVLLTARGSALASELLYEELQEYPSFQIGAVESAGIPLATSLMRTFSEKGREDISMVYVRKSRKKTDLARMIEGPIKRDQNVILVDDILNSGDSLWKAVLALESEGLNVTAIHVVLQYRDRSFYKRFSEKGISVRSLFTLDELASTTRIARGITIKNNEQMTLQRPPFDLVWHFSAPSSSHEFVTQKSRPALDETLLYFGGDEGTFYALDQESGSIVWRFIIPSLRNRKSIFSNPVLTNELVIFGAYDGSLYALNKKDGVLHWKFSGADWIGSSPCISGDGKILYIGLEFGLFRKHGGIAALHLHTGQVLWRDQHPAFTHSSPLFVPDHDLVVIGSNDGIVRAYQAYSGTVQWQFSTYGSTRFDPQLHSGFSEGDIKESFVYDSTNDTIIFGSIDGNLYIIDRNSGSLVFNFTCESGIFSTPVLYNRCVYFTSTDKRVRALNLDTHELVFERILDETRIFADPVVYMDELLVGTNGGRVYVLEPQTGRSKGYWQTTERITNPPVYNSLTQRYFVRTNANEVLCLTRV